MQDPSASWRDARGVWGRYWITSWSFSTLLSQGGQDPLKIGVEEHTKVNSNLKTPENHSAVLTMSTSAFSYKPLKKPTTE